MLTIGADVEGFVQRGDNTVAVVGLIGGTKKKPRIVTNGNLQEDNALAEFAIDIAHTEEQFIRYVRTTMSELTDVVGKVSYKGSHVFDPKYLSGFGSAVNAFGCSPEFSVYTRRPIESPDAALVNGLRTAGGHVHFGYNSPHRGTTARIIQAMDILLGIPSVLMDNDTQRRSMYGQAGACRFKSYGGEYRTLSNFWVNSRDTISWVYRSTEEAVQLVLEGELALLHDVVSPKEVQNIINNHDTGKAADVCTQLNLEVL